MGKTKRSFWPILLVSDKINSQEDEGNWLRRMIYHLEAEQDCTVIQSASYSDAIDMVYSREDLGLILLDWDLKDKGREHTKAQIVENVLSRSVEQKNIRAASLLSFIRERNQSIPILLMTDRGTVEDLPSRIFSLISDTIWKLTDTTDFLSGRIIRHLIGYIEQVLPPFFCELMNYVHEYKYAWHTPGHMGGQGFLKSPAGTALHKFFGEDVLRADLSISVPELGSLLDHSGKTGEAEAFSAKVFGADQTYYVLNGTSTCNQIIWRSQVSPNNNALVDRNCHKSLHYAMVITEADPDYMLPLHNGLGITGPVDFRKLPKGKKYKMSALTNSTYDGVCYHVPSIAEQLSNVEILHFDEAWYAYAKFHHLYKDHFAMDLSCGKLVFASHSTHKLLTAFSQASMIHVKFPFGEEISPKGSNEASFHDLFNESYMMHGSTSPQYNMIASLEVATKMMADNGPVAWDDTILEAIELRKKIASMHHDLSSKGNWFFKLWQPQAILTASEDELMREQEHWLIRENEEWHGFDMKGAYSMLDPIKLTFLCPGVDVDGQFIPNEPGIPAAVVTNYLLGKGIVCEKSDYYSWLLLNSLGTTKGKQGSLLVELIKFKHLYDEHAFLEDVFPELVDLYPEKYKAKTLAEHCEEMHRYIQGNDLLGKMIRAFRNIPQHCIKPSEAYRHVVDKNVESVLLDDLAQMKEDRTIAVMLVPYPPGIPLMMGGEIFAKPQDGKCSEVLDYLLARQEFEHQFPGYESDIHGIERQSLGGKKYFKTLLIKNNP